MPIIGKPSFNQLKVFLTVVETGSFAGAGRQLNRATSVISYAIAALEVQLGLTLFDREGTRKPSLTTSGKRSRRLLHRDIDAPFRVLRQVR